MNHALTTQDIDARVSAKQSAHTLKSLTVQAGDAEPHEKKWLGTHGGHLRTRDPELYRSRCRRKSHAARRQSIVERSLELLHGTGKKK